MEVSPERRYIAALLFMNAAMTTLDAYSTINSSPWTSENFGADEAKAASSRAYVRHAVVFSSAYLVAAAFIAGSLWPIAGAVVTNAYLWWLYDRALQRAQATGSTGWAK